MKKIFTLLTVILTSLAISSYAQTGSKAKVSGKVVDGNTKTLESATITLLHAVDSSVAKMSVADKSGAYQFDFVSPGAYLVSVSAIGHQKGYSELVKVEPGTSSVEVKTIELAPEAKIVGAVTVSARKPLIEQKIDRTVVNVEASITSVGNSALEVLEKSPGVSIDKDGNISLKGKQGVQVYIDGRPSHLSGEDLANLLKNMTASQLEQIEIMTNPPARYDAAGNSGVINIKTKKNKQFGYSGNINTGYTQGRYARFNESGSFNYRKNKINLFTNLSHSHQKRGSELFIDRNFRNATTKDIISTFDQVARMKSKGNYYSGKIGLDYSVTKRTTLGLVLNGFTNNRRWESNTGTDIFEPGGELINHTEAFTNEDEDWKNYSVNTNFRTVLDSAGQELTGDVDYIEYKSTNNQPLYSYYYDRFGNPTQTPDTLVGVLPQNIKIYSGKLDYTLPLKNGAKFEAGVKSSMVETDNNAVYKDILQGTAILDSGRSNHFIYEENINAAYANYSRPLGKKWNAQLGLRVENTIAKGNSAGYEFDQAEDRFVFEEKKFKREYTQLFPTAYLQYKASETNSFVLNYGRRVNRPNYQDLNPFINFLDRYTFQQGNPDLKPQFAHNVELSHTYKGFLTTTVNYTRTTDIIQQVLEQNEITNETFIKQANIASLKQVGLAVTAHKQVTKWWSGNIYLNIFNNNFEGIVNNENISISLTGMMVNAQQQFKWGKGWGAELSGFYRTKGVEGVIYIQPIAQVNAGVSKQVLKNKGTIRVNVRDIFAMSVFKGHSKYGSVDAKFKNVNDSRMVSVGFSWRFSKGKINGGSQRKKGSADDELNRVNVGN